MVLKNDTGRKYENVMPAIDEGWWESVLAEEQRQYRAPKKTDVTLPIRDHSNTEFPAVAPADGATPERRVQLLHSIKPGMKLFGAVSSVTDFGAFIDLGGLEGLIHISELSWGRVIHPSQIVQVGENVRVLVLDISRERSRVALSLKRLATNPWESAEVEFAVNTVQTAIVSSVMSYGAFARLKPGIEGLIHVSKMSLVAGQTPRDVLQEGQEIKVKVLYMDPAHQRMGLRLQTYSDAQAD